MQAGGSAVALTALTAGRLEAGACEDGHHARHSAPTGVETPITGIGLGFLARKSGAMGRPMPNRRVGCWGYPHPSVETVVPSEAKRSRGAFFDKQPQIAEK